MYDQPPRDQSRGSGDRDSSNGESTFGRLNSEPYGDFGGRGRGRSPAPIRRRRSRSPQPAGNIDRYVPGGSPRPRRSRSPPRRYDAGGLGYGVHSQGQNNPGRVHNIDRYVPGGVSGGITPGGFQGAPTPILPDPHKLDYSVTYSYFSEWYSQEHGKDRDVPKDEVQQNYDSYKDDLNARLAKLFVAAHKNDEWFKERYVPGEKEITKAKIKEYRKELWDRWRSLLQGGAFDQVDRETRLQGQKLENGGEPGEMTEEINRGVDDGGLRPVLLIKTISPTVSRKQLEDLANENLTNFHFVSLSDPNPLKKFHRIGFILLKPQDPDDPGSEPAVVDESTVALLNGKSIRDENHGDFVCHVGIHNGPTNPKARKLLNEYMSMPQNLRKEAELVERCARKLENELRDESDMEEYDGWEMIKDRVEEWGTVEREKRETSEEGEEGADLEVELKIMKKKIDIGVEYLRRAFNFCMYCVSCSDSIHELTRKCPGGHIRRPTPSSDYQADQKTINWTKNWQDKLELFVNPPDPALEDYAERLKKIGGKPVYDAVEELVLKFVKQEDEGKYRCKVQACTKLFRGEEFWRKHLDKKHADWLQHIELDAALVNAYVSDPTRVHPPKIEQNAQGNFQAGGMGSNRIQQFPPMGFVSGPPPGGFQPPPGFNFNAAFIQAAAGGANMNGNGMVGGVGPQRRRDNRNLGNGQVGGAGRRDRYGQPYVARDRAEREKERERRDREMKEAQSRRAGSASLGVGGPVGLGAPAPAAGGPEAELAVMGRAVKSYKDLDATEGRKVDELDY